MSDHLGILAGDPPDTAAGIRRLRAARASLLRRFEARQRRGHPEAAEIVLALDAVMVLDAPHARYSRLLERAVQLAPDAGPRVHAGVLRAHARFWSLRGGHRIGRAAVLRAREIASAAFERDHPLDAALLGFIGLHASEGLGLDDEVSAEARALRELARSARLGPAALRIAALAEQAAGIVALARGDAVPALEALQASIDLARRAGADRTIAIALANRGRCFEALGELDRATASLREGLALFEQLDDRLHAAHLRGRLVLIASRAGAALDVPELLALAAASERQGDDQAAAHFLLSIVENAAGPALREDATALLARAWASLARVDAPDLEARARRLSDVWGREASAVALSVSADGRLARMGDRAIDLRSRKALPAVLGALVASRIERPGAYLDVQALFAAGWPGEKAQHHAASARVYMAVRALRDLGLRGALATSPSGYRIEPSVLARWIAKGTSI